MSFERELEDILIENDSLHSSMRSWRTIAIAALIIATANATALFMYLKGFVL